MPILIIVMAHMRATNAKRIARMAKFFLRFDLCKSDVGINIIYYS